MKKILSIATTLLCVLSVSVQANNALSFSATTKQAGLTLDKISPNTTLSFNTPKTSKSIAHASALDKRLEIDLKCFEQTTSKKQNLSRLSMSKNANFLFPKPLPSPELPDWLVIRLSAGANLSKYKRSENYIDVFSAETGGFLTYANETKLGFQGGIGVGFKNRAETFTLLVTPTFVKTGSNYTTNEILELKVKDKQTGKETLEKGFINFKADMLTVHVPILARWRVLGGESFALTAGTGFSLNYTFQGKNDATIETEKKTVPLPTTTYKFGTSRLDDYRAVDVSILLHIGTLINLNSEGTKKLTISYDGQFGMQNKQTQARTSFLDAQGVYTNGKLSQRAGMLNIGLEFWFDDF